MLSAICEHCKSGSWRIRCTLSPRISVNMIRTSMRLSKSAKLKAGANLVHRDWWRGGPDDSRCYVLHLFCGFSP